MVTPFRKFNEILASPAKSDFATLAPLALAERVVLLKFRARSSSVNPKSG